MDSPIVLAFGGGVNSTAILAACEQGLLRFPDLIIFADTGGEKPHTYEHISYIQNWLVERGEPRIVIVRKVDRTGRIETLEDNCLSNQMLPSLAYGFKKCSLKFKKAPQDKYVNNWEPSKVAWKAGLKVLKLIGFDADEAHRAKIKADDKYEYRFPLLEFGWGRDECEEAIRRSGLQVPGKSACFYCPASRLVEIDALRAQYPELMERALAIETGAAGTLKTVRGLGRRFNWGRYIAKQEAQQSFPDIDCGCYDG